MDLMALVNDIKSFPGITRKKTISEVINFFPKFSSAKVLASYGEDAAVVEWDDRVLLLAADGIMQSLMNANPFYAGYYSVLVNINDISAMGGMPIAMVDVLSVKDEKVCGQVMRGMETAVRKFGVPIVGGHTHPDCTYNAIDVAIVGYREDKEQVIYSHTAKAGDDIIFAMDLDGFYPGRADLCLGHHHQARTPTSCRKQMLDHERDRARGLLVRSGKDISNPGTLGTLGMLLETSGKGAIVDVDKIPRPQGVDFAQWLKILSGMRVHAHLRPREFRQGHRHVRTVGVTGAVVGEGGRFLRVLV